MSTDQLTRPKLSDAQMQRALRVKDIEPMMDAIAPLIRDAITRATAPLLARIAELEQRPAIQYRGVWREGEIYSTGDFVTDGGSMWHCKSVSMARPGASPEWQLAVKRGAK